VRFSGEIHDRAGLVRAEQVGDEAAVADVPAHKEVPRIIAHRVERIEVAGIREFVEVDDAGTCPCRRPAAQSSRQ